MVGAPTMSLYSWKQLARWSIDYSCLKKEEQDEAHRILDRDWKHFCQEVVKIYGPLVSEERNEVNKDVAEGDTELAYQRRAKPS